MKKYMIIISFIALVFSGKNNKLENTLLIHVSSDEFSNELIKNNLANLSIYQSEKWIPTSTDRDVFNNIHFSRIFRIYFTLNQRTIDELKQELESMDWIQDVEFDYMRKSSYIPNDPRYNNQWFLESINSNDVWDLWDINNGDLPGNRSVILSSVDLGVNWQHQDLVSNLWQNLGEDADGDGRTIEFINNQWVLDPGDLNGMDDDNWDNNLSTFIDDLVGWDVSGSTYGDNDPDVPNNGGWAHGTHVAGLLAATTNNNIGIASTAFNCSVMSVKCTAESEDPSYISNGFEGVLYAAKAGYHSQGFSIINCSWGGVGYNMFEQELMSMCAIDYNALIFAAAGNDNIEQAHYPSSYENVISVTALGQSNSWNHWATYHNTVDLASPGESIQSCVNNGNGYSSWSGTSMASPVAASVAGLMKATYPSWDAEQIFTMIIATADPIIYSVNPEEYLIGTLGSGRVDAFNAISTPLFPKIELAGIDVIIQNDDNGEINVGETIEFSSILFNDPDWGDAISPEINLTCNDDIIIINNSIALDNISSGEAGINFEPFILEFNQDISPGIYTCNLNFTSNVNGYIEYNVSLPIEFDINELAVTPGDLNQDDTIDVLDIIICINIIIELIIPTTYQTVAGDINQDGMVNVQDVVLLVNSILNDN